MRTLRTRAKKESDSLYENVQLGKGLVAHWRFDEGSGATAYDSAGSHTGTVNSGSWVDGIRNKALQFNGIHVTPVTVSNTADLWIPNELSISLWLKPFNYYPAYACHPIMSWTGIADANFVLYFFGLNDGRNFCFYANRGGVWGNISEGSGVIALNQWYHVVLVYKSKEGGQMYIDTVPIGNKGGGGELQRSNNSSVVIGEIFDGIIDEVRIYNRALTLDEIRELYIRKG